MATSSESEPGSGRNDVGKSKKLPELAALLKKCIGETGLTGRGIRRRFCVDHFPSNINPESGLCKLGEECPGMRMCLGGDAIRCSAIPGKTKINKMLNGEFQAVDYEFVEAVIDVCTHSAQEKERRREKAREFWESAHTGIPIASDDRLFLRRQQRTIESQQKTIEGQQQIINRQDIKLQELSTRLVEAQKNRVSARQAVVYSTCTTMVLASTVTQLGELCSRLRREHAMLLRLGASHPKVTAAENRLQEVLHLLALAEAELFYSAWQRDTAMDQIDDADVVEDEILNEMEEIGHLGPAVEMVTKASIDRDETILPDALGTMPHIGLNAQQAETILEHVRDVHEANDDLIGVSRVKVVRDRSEPAALTPATEESSDQPRPKRNLRPLIIGGAAAVAALIAGYRVGRNCRRCNRARAVSCDACSGTGEVKSGIRCSECAEEPVMADGSTCQTCRGTGALAVVVTCRPCAGAGVVKCPACWSENER